MTNETKKSEVIDWNAPFRAEDFECLIDNDYSEMDERACRVANHCFREIMEKHGIKGVCEKRLYQDRDGEYFVFSSNEQGHPFSTPVPATLLTNSGNRMSFVVLEF